MDRMTVPSPFDDGFLMPAEWAPHARCWMAWPSRGETWGEHLDGARDVVAELANTLAQFEPVTIITKQKNVAEVSLLTGQGVNQLSLAHDDCWIRDMGPTFVVNGDNQVSGIDWLWNAWGHRYQDYERDEAVAAALLDQLKMRRYAGDLVVEARWRRHGPRRHGLVLPDIEGVSRISGVQVTELTAQLEQRRARELEPRARHDRQRAHQRAHRRRGDDRVVLLSVVRWRSRVLPAPRHGGVRPTTR